MSVGNQGMLGFPNPPGGLDFINVPYNPADFTASAGTWTVEQGDLITYAYVLVGKLCILLLVINASSLSSTPATLIARLPVIAAKTIVGPLSRISDNGTERNGIIFTSAGTTNLFIQNQGGVAFSASTNNTSVQITILFPVI